jgi:hypothetical protein
MSRYNDYKRESLKDPAVKREYIALKSDYDLIQKRIDSRTRIDTQKKEVLAKREMER